jgi:sulfhydrogenase subunit alpha
MSDERTYRVELLARVEGEGRFSLRIKDGEVVEAALSIFEAPRFFEAFLRGRGADEVVDLVARICGICPVAYQMSASRAFERAFGVEPSEPTLALRRLMYCGEWIESHALHVFLLHAPDFLGYTSGIEMARDHRAIVERGLSIKKAGNAVITLLGGRATHPISPRIGGFTKAPSRSALRAILPVLEQGLADSIEAVRWTASLPMPELENDYIFVALAQDGAYPIERGERIVVSGRDDVALDMWGDTIVERQVPHSNALQARLHDGAAFLTGPMARLYHAAELLHPIARELMREVGLPREVKNPYRSIVVRTIELVHAFADAIELVRAYVPPEAPHATVVPRASIGCGATEAPRGLLWHRFEIAGGGRIADARIVPPTSQNQARIEADLVSLAPRLLALPHDQATRLCEQLIRAYDPCISCATHFLDLQITR